MFQKGDYIIYGTSGVCQVESITTMEMTGFAKDRLFYVLHPASQIGGKIFTPVDSEKTFMREILTKEQADLLIAEIPHIQVLEGSNDKQMEEQYKSCMRSGNCKDWIKIIKTLYLRKRERISQGKKITATDERYLKQAEEFLYSELAIPLEMPKGRLEGYITELMES